MTAAPLSGFCRVTVVAPTARADLALATEVPVATLLPVLLRELGDAYDGPDATVGWQLCGVQGRSLDSGGSLAAGGVVDGDILVLRPAAAPLPSPLIDDVVDLLATDPHPEPTLVPGAARAMLGTLAAGVASAAVLRLPWAGWSHGPVLVAAGVLAAVAGTLRSRAVAAAVGVGLVALGVQAVPGGVPDVARLALGCGVAAVCCSALLALPAAASVRACWLAGALGSGVVALASAAALVRVGLDGPPLVRAAAGTALLAVALSTRVPRVALRLAGVRRPSPTGEPTAGPCDGDGDPVARAGIARAVLAGATTGVLAALSVSACALALAPGPAARGLGVLAAALAMLRARLFRPVAAVLTGVIGGAVAAAAAGLAEVAAGDGTGVGLVAAGGLAAALAALGDPARADPRWSRVADLLEGALVLALVPLALLAVGAYGAVGR